MDIYKALDLNANYLSQGCQETVLVIQRSREAKTERWKDRNTERWIERETEIQRDGHTERRKD